MNIRISFRIFKSRPNCFIIVHQKMIIENHDLTKRHKNNRVGKLFPEASFHNRTRSMNRKVNAHTTTHKMFAIMVRSAVAQPSGGSLRNNVLCWWSLPLGMLLSASLWYGTLQQLKTGTRDSTPRR